MTNKIALIILLIFATIALGYAPSFNSGELTPLIRYRVDLDKRYMGVETMENFLVKPQGTAERRPGTLYVAEANGITKLVSFEFSTTDAYVLEFGNGIIRFYRDQ